MEIILKYLLLITLFFSLHLKADDDQLDLARDLLTAMDMDSQLKTMAENIRGMQERQLAQLDLPETAQPIMERYLNDMMSLIFSTFKKPEVKEQYAKLYAENFTPQELKELLEFYSTGAGKAFLQKFPQVMAGITKVAEAQLASVQPKLLEMQQTMKNELAELQ
jgi:hypothetical protein